MSKSSVIESSLATPRSEDLLLLHPVIAVRPTAHRLFIAMGVASILLAALLQLDLDLKTGVANYPAEQDVLRILNIARRNVEQTPESSTAEQAIHKPIEDEPLRIESAPDEIAGSEQGQKPDDPADSRVDPEPVRDWYALMEPSAKATVEEYFGREDLRASVWRETRSVMFQPGDEFSVIEERPILPDIKFRQPVGVLGIGFTVGSCFIGIPIFGVPVEERTIAIRLLVCREDSG